MIQSSERDKKIDILIVEDKPQDVEILQFILEEAGYRVKSSNNGQQGIDMAIQLLPQLILMDVMMPDINGFEACRRLKSNSTTSGIPIIFITAKVSDSDEAEGFEAGAVDYIAKPVNEPIVLARVKTHLELKSYRDSLETLVSQRTQALNDTLRELARSNQMKDEFLASINHELRTPLNGIQGSLLLLEDTHLSPEQNQLVNTATNSVFSLGGIVEDVLILTEAVSGTLKLIEKPFFLNHSIETLIESTKTPALLKGLEFTWQIHEEVPNNYVGDATQIMRMIGYLLANAFKFTQKGSINLAVDINEAASSEDSAMLVFKVKDTGIGIPIEKQKVIFKLFQQAEGTITRRFGGLGIGLTICQSLLRLMKGKLTFSSIVDLGSTFTISLPIKLVQATPAATSTQTGSALCANEKTVLIVEDNAVNLLVEKNIVKKCGYQVVTADNGSAALQLLQARSVDAILMDCQMPILDGFEATRKIRTSAVEIRNVPIIAVTANATSMDRERCLEAGMNDYLAKPINYEQLKDKLCKWLA